MLSLDRDYAAVDSIYSVASTQQGISLSQVVELSKKVGLDFQMAHREKGAAFVVPSVVHLKLVACNSDIGIRFMYHEAWLKVSFA
jgi:hypothetical protein